MYRFQFIGDVGFLGVLHIVPVTIGTIPLTSVYSMPSNWSSMPSPFSSFYPPLPASGTFADPADISLHPITSQPGTLPSARKWRLHNKDTFHKKIKIFICALFCESLQIRIILNFQAKQRNIFFFNTSIIKKSIVSFMKRNVKYCRIIKRARWLRSNLNQPFWYATKMFKF